MSFPRALPPLLECCHKTVLAAELAVLAIRAALHPAFRPALCLPASPRLRAPARSAIASLLRRCPKSRFRPVHTAARDQLDYPKPYQRSLHYRRIRQLTIEGVSRPADRA